ncbi:MAG: hypothetical protein E6Q89_00500 [Bacteroidia bacterium]|nr:MAG: hypothetical protein E6Q89_00500 [Bacteroidia bacterium]
MKNKKVLIPVALISILIVAVIFLMSKPNKPAKIPEQQAEVKSFSVVLNQQNNSGESGLATFEEKNGKTIVRIKVVNAPLDTPQPAHLHKGTCKEPISELFDIEDVVNGESETVIDQSLENLLKETPFVLNIHKSLDEDEIYTSCGTIYSIK